MTVTVSEQMGSGTSQAVAIDGRSRAEFNPIFHQLQTYDVSPKVLFNISQISAEHTTMRNKDRKSKQSHSSRDAQVSCVAVKCANEKNGFA